ncbi:MAG TPA: outer membrane lipoprotein carrier protein LolA [Terriglobales bacterium]|nr:outer membrane lipoprotein carrier protein LolA [Terriglobales bacterium]
MVTKRGIAITALALALGASALIAQTATSGPSATSAQASPQTKTPAKSKASTSKTTAKIPAKAVPAPAPAAPAKVEPAKGSADLEAVLDQLDKASSDFKSTEAEFVWEQYQKVVDETDTQKGKIYFVRRDKDNTNMAANIVEPDKKDLTFAEGKLRFYQPRIDQVTEYDAGKNKGEVETFLVLGFGGRGHDLPKSFNLKFAGYETVDGVKTAKLELDPKAQKVKSTFAQIILWVDTARGVSLKQQFIEPSGDYRLAKYSNFKMNGKISDEVFKLKTTSKTKIVKQQ